MPKTIRRLTRVEAMGKNRVTHSKNTHHGGRRHGENQSLMHKKFIFAVTLALLLPLVLIGQQSKKHVPPEFDRKMDAIRNLEYGVAPLFVLGDLNEDGVVDD